MTDRLRVKLFRDGPHQVVRIPREFELPGADAVMRRNGDRLILKAAPAKSLLAVLAALSPISETFPDIDGPASPAVEL